MVEEKVFVNKDFMIVLKLMFGCIESYMKSVSQSFGDKELIKGYKYFYEKYVINIMGKQWLCVFIISCFYVMILVFWL